MTALLLLCFFLSGFSSLVLETVWSKQLSYLLGLDLFGTATAVVAYMLGLGVGAFFAPKAHRWSRRSPLEVYAILQLLIGVLGLLSMPVLRGMDPVFSLIYQLNHQPVLFVLARFFLTLALLLPATTLMGMTLPIVVAALDRSPRHAHRLTGLLYGINTLGAVVGAVTAGFVFIPSVGLLRTSLGAAGLDILIALVVLGFSRVWRTSLHDAPSQDASGGARFQLRPLILLSVALSGVCALGLELSWFRFLVQVLGPSVNALSITFAVFLCGIALGSSLYAATAHVFTDGRSGLVVALAWAVFGATIPVYFINDIPVWYVELWTDWGKLGRSWDLVRTQTALAALVILPGTLGLGAAFPAALAALQSQSNNSPTRPPLDAATATGRLYFANTAGSVVGTIIWAAFILPHSGARGGVLWATACGILALVMVLLAFRSAPISWWTVPLVPALMVLLSRVPAVDPRIENAGLFSAVRGPHAKGKVDVSPLRKEASLVFAKEGYGASVAVVKGRYSQQSFDLVYSGKWVASTHPSSVRHLILLGHLPMLASPTPARRALVIGLGSGITTGHVLAYSSLEAVDVVEIEPVVVTASRYFNRYSGSPLSDARTRVIIQDGRTHVVFGKEKYDVITSDPIHPWVKGAANLYTQQFYRKAALRLTERGVFCQWIPSSMSRRSFATILKTMRSAFTDVKLLFSGGEAIALAANAPISFPTDRLAQALADPRVKASLIPYRLGTLSDLQRFLANGLREVPLSSKLRVSVNTDDNVWLEHALPWEMFQGDRAGAKDYPLANRRPAVR